VRILAVVGVAVALSQPALGQAPRFPVPRGKDSAAVAAIFARHLKATGADTVKMPSRYTHYRQQMAMAGAPPVEMEYFFVFPAPGKSNLRARSLVNMPMMGPMETVVNGSDGWVMSTNGPPMLIDKFQQEQLVQTGNPDPLANLGPGTLSLAKRATIKGREMHGVRYADSLGTDMIMYFDAKTGLASAVKSGMAGGAAQDTTMVILMTDYKSFNGVAIPTAIVIDGAQSGGTTIRVLQMDAAPIDTMMFVPPPAVVQLLKQKKP
jgi:hypothetical protein